MKTTVKIAAMVAALVMTMNCTENEEQGTTGYIGPSAIKVSDGRMTPEVLLSLGRLSDPQLSPDGQSILYGVSYTSVEKNRSVRNLFTCKPDGSGKVQLTTDGKSISNARWSSDGKKIYFISDGQIFAADYAGGRLGGRTQLSDVKAGISGFSLSPDESRVIYVSSVPSQVKGPADFDPALDKAQAYVTEDLMYRHWDHWVKELPQSYLAPFGSEKVTEGNSTNILGQDAGKYELPIEPFSGIEQLAWSPDGKKIAYSCKKLSGKEYAFSTDTEIYIYDTESGDTSVIPMGGGYDTDPVWSPDGGSIAWLSMARNGYEADKTRLFVAEAKPDGNSPVSRIRELTSGFKYNASSPVWSPDGKSIYFSSLAEGIEGIFMAFTGPGGEFPIIRLTDENLWYDFSSPFAVLDDGTILTSYRSLNFPTELVAVKPGSGQAGFPEYKDIAHLDQINGEYIVDGYLPAECPVVQGAAVTRITHENDHILDQLDAPSAQARWTKTIDGKKMLTWVLYPPKFDSSKTYPAIEILLGGPQGTLSQGWSYRWNYRLMASQGYVVTMPNRRGTTAFGQEWCEEISGDYPGLNMQDYLTAGHNIKKQPYIGKLAACGASYGGYSVYYLAGIHGNLYDCFIAHAGIFDEKYMYYETEEMWFPNWDNGGLEEYSYTPGQTGPAGDGITFGGMKQGGSPLSKLPKAQRHYAQSPVNNVAQWHTPILCIHGMMDFRIPYDQGMAAFNAAQMMGVPSKLIVFPEECHWILKPQNALFWHREYFDWLDKWCKEKAD